MFQRASQMFARKFTTITSRKSWALFAKQWLVAGVADGSDLRRRDRLLSVEYEDVVLGKHNLVVRVRAVSHELLARHILAKNRGLAIHVEERPVVVEHLVGVGGDHFGIRQDFPVGQMRQNLSRTGHQ